MRETVHVTYDDKELPLETLLELFYNIIDPTSLNKQGLDEGTQYRTGIYTVDDADLAVARRSLEKLQTWFDKPVVVELHAAGLLLYGRGISPEVSG